MGLGMQGSGMQGWGTMQGWDQGQCWGGAIGVGGRIWEV